MNAQHNQHNWRVLADRFIWSDENALSLIPEGISDEELQKYLYTYHNDYIAIEEIKKLRAKQVQDQ